MPKTSTSSLESGSGSAKKEVPTNRHGGKDPWKAIVDHQTKVSQVLMAKEKEKRDQTTKQLKADLTILSLEKEGKRNKDTEQKNKERKELIADQASHIQALRAEKEKQFQKRKSVTNELTLQRARSENDYENQQKHSEKLDQEMIKASNEAFKKRLKLEEQKKNTLKQAIVENKMEGEVRKIMKQEQTKDDQTAHRKQIEQSIKVQLQKEDAHKEYFRKISQKQENRTDAFAQKVYFTSNKKDREYHEKLEKEVKERENHQNKQFLDSLEKDKQIKRSFAAVNRSQIGVLEAGKAFERQDYSKKVQDSHQERKNHLSDMALEREERSKKQKEYKLTLDQQAFNSHEKRRNADDMTEHELKMNQKTLDAFTNGEHDVNYVLPGFSDPTANRRVSIANSRRSSIKSQISGTQSTRSQGGKKILFNPITGAELAY